jgi:hypothetical protein
MQYTFRLSIPVATWQSQSHQLLLQGCILSLTLMHVSCRPWRERMGKDRASASKGRESSKVKFRPAPPHTVSVSAWTVRRRGGHSAQHLRSRSACDRLILTIWTWPPTPTPTTPTPTPSETVLQESQPGQPGPPLAVPQRGPRSASRLPLLLQCSTPIPRQCAKPLRFAQGSKPSVACMLLSLLLRGP